MISKEDYYEVLDLNPGASEKQIRRHYQILASKWHPQKNSIGRSRAEKVFTEISEAYEVLSNRRLRNIYNSEGFDGVSATSISRFDLANFTLEDAEKVFEKFSRGHDPFAIIDENDPFFDDEFFNVDEEEFFEEVPAKYFETLTNTKKKMSKSPRRGGVEKSVKTVIVDKDGRRIKKTVTTITNADGSQEVIEEECDEPSSMRYLRD